MGGKSTVRNGAGDRRAEETNNDFFDRIEREKASAEAGTSLKETTASGPAPAGKASSSRNAIASQAPESALRRRPVTGAPTESPRAGTAPVIPASTASATERPHLANWGWLPALILVAAVGLICVGDAMQLALDQRQGASLLLWLGFLLIYAPVSFRMALPQTPRRERIALAVWLGLALYLVKILRSPAGFTFHDEFPHYATADMILRTQHLFGPNSLQGVSAYFPGLEIVTSALASVGGLSIEAAGLIVIGAARLLASLGVYLLYEEISGSPRVAGVGSVLTIAYPNYVFWSSQYSYESLALPLAILVLLIGLMKGRRNVSRGNLTIMALVVMAAVTVTHHITSYFLVATLVAIYLVARFGRPAVAWAEQQVRHVPRLFARLVPGTLWVRQTEHTAQARDWAPLALAGTGLVGIWMLIVGSEIVSYLWPHITAATTGFIAIFRKTSAARQPFSSNTATTPAATWEQLVAFAAVLLILVVIPFGLIQIWRRYRGHGVALLFALMTIAYPVTLVLRLSKGGAEIANRSWDFLFVAFGFVLAAGIAEIWMARSHPVPRAGAFAAYASVLLVGAVIVGTPAWARLPGPFLVGGDTRGLQPESYALTNWARDTLGPDNRFIADYSNKLLLGSFGEQYIVTGASWVYISPNLSRNSELADLVRRDVQFIVVDDRLATQTPRIGHYFEPGEPDSPWTQPIPVSDLTKFDKASCLSRIFDSGHITVYSVSPACAAGQGGGK